MPSLADGSSARTELAADLGAALVAGSVVVLISARVAGESPGGWLESCGKTQLAVSIVESLWQTRRLELLAWVVATSRASVLSGYAEAAVDALAADPGGNGESAAARFAGWLGQTSRPWLVVLDDLRDMADLEGLWPSGPAGRVLVTTGNPVAFSDDQGALIHRVGVFSPHEAQLYVTGRLTAHPDKLLGAEDLVHELGYEPLALAQASAVIASSAQSCRDYLARFARRREQQAGAGAAAGAQAAASATWAISVDHAGRLSSGGAAHALLGLAALLDGHGIPADAFTAPTTCAYLAEEGGGDPADPGTAQEALLAAERAGLLSVDSSGTASLVRMNAVVQAAVRAAMPAGRLDRAAIAAAGALLRVWPDGEQPLWLAQALRSCVVSLQRASGDLLLTGGCHPLLLRAGQSLSRARLSGPAVSYWNELAAVTERILGGGHPDTLAVNEQLAGAYLAAGRAAEAVSCFRSVLAERVRVLGPDHPSALAARRDLGHALVAAGEFGDAVIVLDRVVGDYERARGADQLETLGAREELAAAHYAAGHFADAIRLYRSTLASRERVQGAEHSGSLLTRHRLASAYLADGKPKIALSHYKRVLAGTERVLGPDHLDTIAVRAALGSAYRSAGRMASALQLYEQTRASYERVLGADHPDTLANSVNLARIYDTVGRVTDATILLRDTLARCEQVLPPDDPLTSAVRRSLTNAAGG
jgi:tetratricopeptide (TPR) repeat protein